MAGGFRGAPFEATDTLFVLDPSGRQGASGWDSRKPLPEPRGAATAAHERYDPVADDWDLLAPLPTARSAGVLGAMGGRLYYAGGEVPQLFDLHDVWDPQHQTWIRAPAMALALHGVDAVIYEGGLLAAGGGRVQGFLPTDTVDRYVSEIVFLDDFELADVQLWATARGFDRSGLAP